MSDSSNEGRTFLQSTAAGIAIAGSMPDDISTSGDSLVVGGGTAGTIGAIQAGRTGAKRLLLERGALIPKASHNIMVAGRCLSSDRLANSGLRVQAPCMAMGQAAAVTASLAARSGATPGDVPLAEIHQLLRDHGAIVPDV